MKNYRVQDGCYNCKHAFMRDEYEGVPEYYCTLNAPPRPLCGSTLMNEAFTFDQLPENYEQMSKEERREFSRARSNAWFEWQANRRVADAGICDSFEKAGQL